MKECNHSSFGFLPEHPYVNDVKPIFHTNPAFENLQNPANHYFHNYICLFIFTVCWLCLVATNMIFLILTHLLTELTTK